jgi:prepilin-type N-terminal cleavage/methylation domain-containing protein
MENERSVISTGYGFTLIELMLALLFFAIVTAIALPSFRGYIENTKLKAAARQIVSDMAEAQQRAKAENAQYRITLGLDPANTYTVDRVTAPAETQTKTLAEHGSIRITATTFTASEVNFLARGILSEDNRTITLRNSRNSTAQITSNLAGRTHVQYTMQ